MEEDKPEKKQLHPLVKRQIIYMMKQDKIGTNFRNIKFSKSSISTIPGDENWANKFLLSIPYAGKTLEWHLKFFEDDVMYAPDFYTNDGEPFFNILTKELVEEEVTSWTNWDPNKPTALYRSVMEFLALYNHKEMKKLYRHPKLFCEYRSLLKSGLRKEEIEVKVESRFIKFLVPLNVDFTNLPPDIVEDPKLVPKPVLLLISFGSYPKCVTCKFFCVPKIGIKFSESWSRQLPEFRPPMVDYISEVETFLDTQLYTETRKYVLTSAYFTYLTMAYESNILEYDDVDNLKAAFLFNTDGFHYILIIRIGKDFPNKKPIWIVRSLYAFYYYVPLTEIVVNYPYNPDWNAKNMVKTAMKYIQENVIPEFRKRNRIGFYA